jgi:hypothetical protein
MEIGDLKYSRKNYEDYLDYKRRNPDTQKRMFSSFGRLFFINPVSLSGGEVMTLWGAIQADELSDPTSVPIFSNNKSEANEAVVQKAFSVAIKRVDPSLSKNEEQEATVTLLRLGKLEQDNTQRNQRLDHPSFNVPDFFGGNNGSIIGNFGLSSEEEDD